MVKKLYKEGSFGDYLAYLIEEHNFSKIKFASELGISKTYLFDIFSGRVKPPTPDMQERIVQLLCLNIEEKRNLYNKAAIGRKELPKDIVEYLTNNQIEIEKIRERMGI